MDKEDVRLAKKKILKCLTEDFDLKGSNKNKAIFDPKEGFANYSGTDLEMVMEKVMRGLYFAMAESQARKDKKSG